MKTEISPRHSTLAIHSVCLLILLLPPFARGASSSAGPWSFEASASGIAAGMSGDLTVRGIDADLTVGLDDVLTNLHGSATGFARIAYRRLALTAEATYFDLAAHKNGVSADVEQWQADATVSLRLFDWFTPVGGFRYNNIDAKISGLLGQASSGKQDWVDPFVGAKFQLPLLLGLHLVLYADVGGVDGDVTAQLFPYVDWHFGKTVSLQAGYRLLYTDHENGSGADRFRYEVLTQGVQVGLTLHF